MTESDLAKPVANWLRSRGCRVYAEAPAGMSSARVIDLVGRRDRHLICVELKRSATRGVVRQGYVLRAITPAVYVAVATKPRRRSIETCARYGLGLIHVSAGLATPILEPVEKRPPEARYRADLHKKLDRVTPSDDAGRPTTKGEGPAIECARRVALYRAKHPGAAWPEIYKNVANHYAHAASLAQSMKQAEERQLR